MRSIKCDNCGLELSPDEPFFIREIVELASGGRTNVVIKFEPDANYMDTDLCPECKEVVAAAALREYQRSLAERKKKHEPD